MAARDEDCALRAECGAYGACHAGDGLCEATQDADCRKTLGCVDYGTCSAKSGQCVATEADCKKSNSCRALGMCFLEGGMCLSGPKADRCRILCRENGQCTPTADEDCTVLSSKMGPTGGDITRQCTGERARTETVHVEALSPQAMRAVITSKTPTGTMTTTMTGTWVAAQCND